MLQVRNSTKLKKVLEKVLYIGNIFDSDRRLQNPPVIRSDPVFGLAGLSRLKEKRSPNSKVTAMHYLCKSCADKNPEILDFPKDLISLEAASKIELKSLAEEIEGISDCLEKAKKEVAAADNDDPFFENFQKAALKEFVVAAEAELSSVKDLYNVSVKNGDKLAQYFDAKSSLEKVVAALVDFVETFKRACEDNIAIAEQARQRAVDEAAMDIIEAYEGPLLSIYVLSNSPRPAALAVLDCSHQYSPYSGVFFRSLPAIFHCADPINLRRLFGGGKMSQVFEGYERQYCEISANLSKKVTSASVLDGERKKQKVSEITGGLEDAEALIRKMDLEARSLPPNVKATLLAKLREYKTDLNNLKSEVKRMTSANANLAARDDLLESGMTADTLTASADQRARLLMSTERLNKSGDRIREGRKTMLETEELGVSILQDLHQQRQSLLQAHNTLNGVDDNIGRSKKILTNMSRRMSRNKWIIGLIIVVLVISILVILYFKLTR
ncbi:vesicle transport V-snare 13 [Perilla frutescens var. hirtella]|nr:vesicle transport V-snare 13 [Perilla frutescens var. hirtella]